ncbi:hypothetical protein RBSWK_03380 [Rhodopirellula baltica SWK14]|uniref:Uncharacterized protein n=1 Tax=Rhodopirellula baltica SWK14 TaxID=993516 RepID=L7CGF1_RHOBT|nr:hypothetical protein RBSWK_03380 [Rhodopirellula baltica SWK14]
MEEKPSGCNSADLFHGRDLIKNGAVESQPTLRSEATEATNRPGLLFNSKWLIT